MMIIIIVMSRRTDGRMMCCNAFSDGMAKFAIFCKRRSSCCFVIASNWIAVDELLSVVCLSVCLVHPGQDSIFRTALRWNCRSVSRCIALHWWWTARQCNKNQSANPHWTEGYKYPVSHNIDWLGGCLLLLRETKWLIAVICCRAAT